MDSRSNKILIFTTAFRPFIGGSEIALEEIIRRLPEFFFDIITPRFKKSLPLEERGNNFIIHRVGMGLPIDKFLFPIVGFFYAKNILRDNKKAIIHSYQASYGAGAAWLFKIFNPSSVFILTMQEGKNLKKQGFLINYLRKLIIWKVDSATAISQHLGDYLLSIRKKMPVTLIPNGVDLENFSHQFSYGELMALEDKLNIKPDDLVIISVSRLVPKNGLDLLIRAVAEIKTKNRTNNYKLILIGEGSEEKKLKTLTANLELDNNITFVGSVDHRDLPLYLNISDVFVRPSRSEGLGSSFIEAMAAKIPIIGPKVGGIPDFLKDRETGLFCLLTPEDIAFKIHIIFENRELSRIIINNAYQLVKTRYDWNEIAGQVRRLYNKIVLKPEKTL